MLRINQIKIPVQADEDAALAKKIAHILRVKKPYKYRIVRKSLDARDKQNLMHIYTADVEFENSKDEPRNLIDNKNIMSTNEAIYCFPYQCHANSANPTSQFPCHNLHADYLPPVIIGAGPAGYFAALMLARAGYAPLVFERGKCVEERTKDVENFWSGKASVCANSNVSFGEGGAGTFSDGKLNTGIKDKSGRIRAVIREFIRFGAPEEIAYFNKPHIGTDVLKHVMKNMRQEILACGGSIFFSHQMTGLAHTDDNRLCVTVRDLTTDMEREIQTDACILAIGHSARDTFRTLHATGIPMEAKAFAMGVRIEHPQAVINRGQYGDSTQARLLPAADYKMTYRSRTGRSVYSFCMCPGGYVVNASSGDGQCVVNGMSDHARDGANANSAIVVGVTPEDFAADGFGDFGVLAGMEFQEKYERLAWEEGHGRIPVQRFGDYRLHRRTAEFGMVRPDIRGLYAFGDLNNCLPAYVNDAIIEGITDYNRKLKGFSADDAVLSGIESRTSSPVRILRGEGFQSDYRGLFPCGEGAGYAGGITSAAVDGIKTAEAVAEYINERYMK